MKLYLAAKFVWQNGLCAFHLASNQMLVTLDDLHTHTHTDSDFFKHMLLNIFFVETAINLFFKDSLIDSWYKIHLFEKKKL